MLAICNSFASSKKKKNRKAVSLFFAPKTVHCLRPHSLKANFAHRLMNIAHASSPGLDLPVAPHERQQRFTSVNFRKNRKRVAWIIDSGWGGRKHSFQFKKIQRAHNGFTMWQLQQTSDEVEEELLERLLVKQTRKERNSSPILAN